MKQSPIHFAVLTLSEGQLDAVSRGSNSHFGYFSDEFERLFDTLIADFCAFLEFCVVCVSVEAQDEVRFVGGNSDQVASARPVDLYKSSVNAYAAQFF